MRPLHTSFKIVSTIALLLLWISPAFSQLDLKLQLMNDSTWGVYVKPKNTINPTSSTITGSGQVTLVVPTGFTYSTLTSVKGTWMQNARVNGPFENPTKDYISIGFVSDNPQIVYQSGQETLLFTFKKVGACPDTMYLIQNGVDPFDQLPNSANSNPGNDLSVIDLGRGGLNYYYTENYALAAWNCHDCDADGILNALEDTNGNGYFDVGDVSAICDACSPNGPRTATLSVLSGYNVICAGDVGDTSYLKVTINGGRSPYRIIYTNGSTNDTINNYVSGTSIPIVPTSSVNFSLVNVRDSFLCNVHADSLFGTIPITVQGPLSFTTHPANKTICSAQATTFTSATLNGGDGTTNYRWQISTNGGTTYTDIADGTPYSTASTATLNISSTTGLHNRRYRVKIWTTHCDTVYSNSALMQVEGPISITSSPAASTICAGSNTTFTASATNAGAVGTLSYKWQVNSGSGWADLSDGAPYSGTSTTTLSLTAPSVALDNNLYRMKAFTGTCDTVYTSTALLDIQGPLTITTHPADVSRCANTEAFFFYQYTNPGAGTVTFQWQQSLDGGTSWNNLSNATVYNNTNGTSLGTTGDTLAITNVIGLDGSKYRVGIRTSQCGIVYSNAATLSVNGVPSFSTHPTDATICAGSSHFFVAAASIAQGSFTYNWQVSTNGGASYSNISPPSGVYTTSSGGDTLFISNVIGLYNYRYRAQAITSNCSPVNSNEARLSVEGPLSVTTHPANDTVCSGSSTTFNAVIANPGVTGSTIFRWQVSSNGGSTWTDITNNATYNGAGTQTLSISNAANLYNYRYRLRAWTSTCSVIFTNAAILTVEGPVTVNSQPVAVTTCSGKTASFSASVSNGGAGTMSYQWRVSTDNGLNWSNLSNTGVYSGVNTTTLNISNVASLYHYCYQLQITTGECAAVYTQKACLTVEGPLAITAQPQNVTACSGAPVLFTVGTTNGSSNPNNKFFIWQESTNGGSTWSNLQDGSVYNGVKTDTMSISNIAGKGNNRYRVKYWTNTCDTLTSEEAILYVEGPLSVVSQPSNATICSGSGTTFQATIANTGLGTLNYQWESSSNNGVTWSEITAGGVNGYSGVTTTSLNITNVAGLGNNRFRLRYWTNTCNNAYTNFAVLTVEGPISIIDQPDPVTACSGGTTSFSVATANTGSGQISYQWQVKPNGVSTWTNVTNSSVYNGATSSTLSVVVAGLHGSCFRAIIQTATCSSVTSDSACLSVEGPVSFNLHPQDVTSCSGQSVRFSGAASIAGGNAGTITYQWQVSSDNGVNWSNLTNTAPYFGVTTDTLTVSNIAGLNNRRYRLSARTTTCSPVYSNNARLTVEGPIVISSHPADWTTCSNKEAFFHARITNSGQGTVNYQWQVSSDNGSTWSNLANVAPYNGVKTDTLGISPVSGLVNYKYRMKAWTGTCDTLTSNSATLGIEGPLVVTDEPDDVVLCSNSPTSFSVAVTNQGLGVVVYQWQRSTNGGQTWSDISNGGVFSGVTTNTLSISNITGLGNHKFRAKYKTTNCEWNYSVAATLFVEGPITISQHPASDTACSNIGHLFNTTITNPGSGVLTFQWQLSTNGGSTWSNISNGGVYLGARTEDLSISRVENMNGYRFRLIARTSTCADTTNVAILTVWDACSVGACDFDLDGVINDVDPDDDNDQLSDYYENWMNVNNLSAGWNYTSIISFPYSRCNRDSDADGLIDGLEDPDGDNISNNEETDGDSIFDGDPLNPCDPVLGPTCIGINLAIKLQLLGAKIGVSPTDTLMRDDLRSKGYIPVNEPYTGRSGYSHKGGGGNETVTDSTTVFSVTGPNAIVDWVYVELRSPAFLDSVIYTRSALLQRDGDVVDVNGSSMLSIPLGQGGSYYVSVRHRNHLGVMTGEALDLSPILTEIDFTDTSLLTNGTYAQIRLNNKMSLWAGDLNGDRRTIYQGPGNDVLKLFNTVLTDTNNTGLIANYISQGYLDADIDLNGRAIYQGPANDRAMVLFNVILNYPANGSNLANYVILQQLP